MLKMMCWRLLVFYLTCWTIIAAVPKPVTRLYDNVPFGGDLPAGFHGVDVKALCTRLEALRFEKGEYETTKAFEARKDRLLSAPVLGTTLTARSPFAVVFAADGLCGNEVTNEYDADKGVLSVELVDQRINDSYFSAFWLCSRKELGSYVAQNSFGVKRLVKRVGIEDYGIAIDFPNRLFPTWHSPNISKRDVQLDIKMGIDDARRLNHHLAFVIAGTLRDPIVRTSESMDQATLDMPVEVNSKHHLLDVDAERMMVVYIPTGEIVYEFKNAGQDQ